ncbi:hypothetical protein MBLNU230_g3925t1 [Neophaeotheca triangularis]
MARKRLEAQSDSDAARDRASYYSTRAESPRRKSSRQASRNRLRSLQDEASAVPLPDTPKAGTRTVEHVEIPQKDDHDEMSSTTAVPRRSLFDPPQKRSTLVRKKGRTVPGAQFSDEPVTSKEFVLLVLLTAILIPWIYMYGVPGFQSSWQPTAETNTAQSSLSEDLSIHNILADPIGAKLLPDLPPAADLQTPLDKYDGIESDTMRLWAGIQTWRTHLKHGDELFDRFTEYADAMSDIEDVATSLASKDTSLRTTLASSLETLETDLRVHVRPDDASKTATATTKLKLWLRETLKHPTHPNSNKSTLSPLLDIFQSFATLHHPQADALATLAANMTKSLETARSAQTKVKKTLTPDYLAWTKTCEENKYSTEICKDWDPFGTIDTLGKQSEWMGVVSEVVEDIGAVYYEVALRLGLVQRSLRRVVEEGEDVGIAFEEVRKELEVTLTDVGAARVGLRKGLEARKEGEGEGGSEKAEEAGAGFFV